MTSRPNLASVAAVVVGCVLPSAPANASNGTKDRTPVIFHGEQCMMIVDKTVDPIVQIDYTIPLEDVLPEPRPVDEVEDSRRHQFIAMCRQHDLQTEFPLWLSQADVDEADAIDSLPPDGVTSDDVLESHPDWSDCFFRVNEDDDRRLITCESVDTGVTWDVTDVPPGVYNIMGYTWEPWANLWSRRSGVIKVVDGTDDTFPAAAMMHGVEPLVWEGEAAAIKLCVDALDGSTLTAYWSIAEADKPVEWVPFIEDEPIPCNEPAVVFPPPEDIERPKNYIVRIDVTDPMGRTYTAHRNVPVETFKGVNPEACNTGDGSSFIGPPSCDDTGDDGSADPNDLDANKGDACGVIAGANVFESGCVITPPSGGTGDSSGSSSGPTSASPGTSDDGSGASSSSPGASGGGKDGGCACTATPGGGFLAMMMLPLGLMLLDRRRP